MNLDLRNVLIAKTVLLKSEITKLDLIKTAVQEAQKMKNDPNFGHRNKIAIKLRANKIFKNLLKQYNKKQLIKQFVKLDTNSIYFKEHKELLTSKSKKSDIIQAIVLSSHDQIINIIRLN